MSKYFVNVCTEYKSFETSNQYIKETILKIGSNQLDFVIVDNSLDNDNFEKLSCYYTRDYETLLFEGKEIRRVELCFGERHTTVFYVKNNHNTGYGKGSNLAMNIAIQFLNPEYFIISNNDMICMDDQINLDKVVSVFDNNQQVGLIGVNIKNLDGSAQSPCREVSFTDRWILPEIFFPLSVKFKKRKASDLIENPESGLVYRVRGSFMILKTDAFLKSGGFDDNIFLYAEEPILTERLARNGYLVYHLNDIHMLHNHVMDNKKITSSDNKKIKQRFLSELYYYENYKNISKFQIRLAKMLFPQYYWRYKMFRKIKAHMNSK